MNKDLTVSEYITSVDPKAKKVFDELRAYILSLDSRIEEKMAYGILGFYLGKQKLYIGGYKTHVGLYPGPTLIDKHKSTIGHLRKAKGTLHLPLNKEVPFDQLHEILKETLGIN